jgi:hypothetical protein
MSTYSSVHFRDAGLDRHPQDDWWDVATSLIEEPLRICHGDAKVYLDVENARRLYRALHRLFGPVGKDE